MAITSYKSLGNGSDIVIFEDKIIQSTPDSS